MRHGDPALNGKQYRPYVSSVAFLTYLTAASASVAVCRALGMEFHDEVPGKRVKPPPSADVGVYALRMLGVLVAPDGTAYINPDSTLARMAGLRDCAQALQQRVLEQQGELQQQMRINLDLAAQLETLRNGIQQQTASARAEIMALNQRGSEIHAMLLSERALYGQVGGYGLRWPRGTHTISARSRLGTESRSRRDRVCASRPPKAVATYLTV